MTTPGLSRRRFLQLAAGVGAVASVPALRQTAWAAGDAPPAGHWLAGDFHVHTTYSHDVWGGPSDDNTSIDEAYTFGWTPGQQITNAETRGLNFVALTDHDRVTALTLPEYRSSKLVLVPGYEHSLNGGHAGIFMRSVDDLPTILTKQNDGTAGLNALLDQVHERNGMMILNHPKGGAIWTYDLAPSRAVDAVEVWNGQWLQRHDVLPVAESNNHVSMMWWEQNFLGAGARRAAVGGSDNHWVSVSLVAGVGQPTTWVFAANRSASAIIDAVKAGRTTVSWQPPALLGPRLELTATELYAEQRTTMVGGEVRPNGPVAATVRVIGGAGHRLRVINSGQVAGTYLVDGPDVTHCTYLVLPRDGWLRAELYVDPGYAMTALTSPIWAAATDAPPSVFREANLPLGIAPYGIDVNIPEIGSSTPCCGH